MGRRTSRILHHLAAGVLLCLLAGCPDPPTLTDSYLAQGPGDVDMLWIIDSSGSMVNIQGQLDRNFSSFVEVLPETSTTRMAITTSQAWNCLHHDPAVAGCDDSVGTAGRYRRNYDDGMPVEGLLDPSDEDDQLVFQALAHVGAYGTGFERPMQAALMAVCEAVDLGGVSDFDPDRDNLEEDFPDGCRGDDFPDDHPYHDPCHCLPLQVDEPNPDDPDLPTPVALHNSNFGLLRGDNPLHVVIVTNEGDGTSELENFGGGACESMTGDELCDCRLDHYLGLMQMVVPDVRVSVIGPGQGPDAPEDIQYACNPDDSCGVDFFFNSVDWTQGSFSPIQEYDETNAECLEADLAPALADLVLHHPAIEWFKLSAIPVIETMTVTVDDDSIPQMGDGSTCVEGGFTTGGWTYDGEMRGVSIVGDCTAFSSATIKITYESAGPLLVM